MAQLTEMERTQRAARLAWFDLTERLRYVGIGALLILVLLFFWWIGDINPHPDDTATARACAANYSRARNAVDTAFVDRERPFIDKVSATAQISCGELRLTGQLPAR